MTRGKSNHAQKRHYEYATVILTCAPSGHEVGRAYRQPDGRTLISQATTRVHPPGERLRLVCPDCRAEGRRAIDLQMSWERLDEALAAELADTNSPRRKLRFG